MSTPEHKVKEGIKKYLNEIGAYYFMSVQTGYGAATLDFLCCINGVFVAIEAKREGGKPTPRQAVNIAKIKDAGGIAFYVTSVEELKAIAENTVTCHAVYTELWEHGIKKVRG